MHPRVCHVQEIPAPDRILVRVEGRPVIVRVAVRAVETVAARQYLERILLHPDARVTCTTSGPGGLQLDGQDVARILVEQCLAVGQDDRGSP